MKKKILILLIFCLLFLIFSLPLVYANTPIGNFLEFFGGYIKVATNYNFSPTGFSFEAWVKPKSVSGVSPVLSIGEKDSEKLHYEIGINGGSLYFDYYYSKGSRKVITAGNIKPDAWNHLAVSLSSQQTALYINGVKVFMTNGAENLYPIGSNVVLGNSFLEPAYNKYIFKGEIDEVRISKTSRDISSLWQNYWYKRPLNSDKDTVVLWHLDGSRGQTNVLDSSSYKNHGLLVGSDAKIHYHGVLPTLTPIPLPTTIKWQSFTLPVLPTVRLPSRINLPSPTNSQEIEVPKPTPTAFQFQRSKRPVFPR